MCAFCGLIRTLGWSPCTQKSWYSRSSGIGIEVHGFNMCVAPGENFREQSPTESESGRMNVLS